MLAPSLLSFSLGRRATGAEDEDYDVSHRR